MSSQVFNKTKDHALLLLRYLETLQYQKREKHGYQLFSLIPGLYVINLLLFAHFKR
jgi:hypothetical protein